MGDGGQEKVKVHIENGATIPSRKVQTLFWLS